MRITGVFADFPGATVTVAASAGALSVTVSTTIDLDLDDGETGVLVVAGTGVPFTYTAAVDDEDTGVGTVTVAAPGLPAAVEAGDALRLWDAQVGAETVGYGAKVADDEGGTFDATFAAAPSVTIESLIGAEVDVDDDDVITRVYGREAVLDGGYVGDGTLFASSLIDPENLPDPTTPTEAPATSPVLTVTGTAESLVVEAEAVEASTEIEYHISTVAGFTPDATTLSATTRSNVYVATSLPDGSRFAAETTYYLKSVATNVVGSAAASAEVTGQLNPDVLNSLVAAKIVAGFILTGSIQVGQMTIDADTGITIPQPDGGTIHLPVDGSDAQITAHITARSLNVEDAAVFTGLTDLFGTIRLGRGVPTPKEAPTVTRTWPTVTAAFTISNQASMRGLVHSSDGLGFFSVDESTSPTTIDRIDNTGAFVSSFSTIAAWRLATVYGITRVGTKLYVLGVDSGTSGWRIYSYNEDGTGQTFVTSLVAQPYRPAISTDGTNLLIASVNDEGILVGEERTTTDGTFVSATILGTTIGNTANRDVLGVAKGTFDLGVTRWMVARSRNAGDAVVDAYNSTGTSTPTHSFDGGPNVALAGLTWDGTRFHTLDEAGNLRSMTTGNVVDETIDVAYSWYDADAGGTGTHETVESPRLEDYTLSARSAFTVQTPPAPEAASTSLDAANQARIYAAAAGGTLWAQGATGVAMRELQVTTRLTSGSNPKLANEFDSIITPAVLVSDAKDAGGVNPLTDLRGDGYARVLGNDTWQTITPLNGYNASVGPTPARRLDPTGRIELRGRIELGTATNGATLFVLPVGQRPTQDLEIGCVTYPVASTTGRLQILTTGAVSLLKGMGTPATYRLDGVNFSTI